MPIEVVQFWVAALATFAGGMVVGGVAWRVRRSRAAGREAQRRDVAGAARWAGERTVAPRAEPSGGVVAEAPVASPIPPPRSIVRRDLAALGPTPPTLISVPDLSARAQDRPAPREPLDGRAQAVVAALAEGRSLDEIAAAWNVSRAHIELIARLARRAAARETSPSSTGRQ